MKDNLILVLSLIVIAILWHYPPIYPLKILVVFFHELSHALMVVATGGEVLEMVVNHQQGGHVQSLGGNRFLTLTAGYLGSLLWGMGIYFFAVKLHLDKLLMGALGVLMLVVGVIFISNFFALIFCFGIGALMITLALKAAISINDLLLRIIGLTNMLYVPLDIYSDTLARSYLKSDAAMLADYLGGTTILWGSLWLLISLMLIFFTLKVSHAGPNKTP